MATSNVNVTTSAPWDVLATGVALIEIRKVGDGFLYIGNAEDTGTARRFSGVDEAGRQITAQDGIPSYALATGTGWVLSVTPAAGGRLPEGGDVDTSGATFAAMNEPSGFQDADPSILAWTDSTPDRTLTLTPAPSFKFWVGGVMYLKDAVESIQIADTEGLHYIYYDTTGTLVETTTFTTDLILRNALVAVVYWDATNKLALGGSHGIEMHGIQMDGATHLYEHTTEGARFLSGHGLGNFDSDNPTPTNASAQFDIADGQIADEDLRLTATDDAPQDLSPILNAPVIYRDATDWRFDAATAYPVKTGGTGRLAYNDIVAGSGAQVEATNGRYVLAHIIRTNIAANPVVAMQGQAEYININDATTGAEAELAALFAIGLPFVEWTVIGTVIYQTSNGYGNAVKARVRTNSNGDDWVDFRFANVTPASPPTDHPALGGRSLANQHPAAAISTANGSDAESEIAAALSGHIDGLGIAYVSTSTIQIADGVARDASNTGTISAASLPVTDITASGANGLDTGAVAADSWYYVWVCSGASGTCGIFSLSDSAPTLPAGYDVYTRRIGTVRADGAANIRGFYQSGLGRMREYEYAVNLGQLLVLAAGSAVAWTSVDCSVFVPPVAARMRFTAYESSGTAIMFLKPLGNPGALGLLALQAGGEISDGFTNAGQSLEYYVAAGTGAAWVGILGFTEGV